MEPSETTVFTHAQKNCKDRRCDTISGHCPSCVPGYMSLKCNQGMIKFKKFNFFLFMFGLVGFDFDCEKNKYLTKVRSLSTSLKFNVMGNCSK